MIGKRNFPYYVRKDRGETEETTTIASKIQASISEAQKIHQVRLDRGVQRAGDIRNEVREALNRNN